MPISIYNILNADTRTEQSVYCTHLFGMTLENAVAAGHLEKIDLHPKVESDDSEGE